MLTRDWRELQRAGVARKDLRDAICGVACAIGAAIPPTSVIWIQRKIQSRDERTF